MGFSLKVRCSNEALVRREEETKRLKNLKKQEIEERLRKLSEICGDEGNLVAKVIHYAESVLIQVL